MTGLKQLLMNRLGSNLHNNFILVGTDLREEILSKEVLRQNSIKIKVNS